MNNHLSTNPAMDGMRLATELKRLRTISGLSLHLLSDRAFVDVKYLFELESGKKARPSRDVLIRIGIGLNLEMADIDELLTEAGHLPLVPLRPSHNPASPAATAGPA